MPSWNRHIAPHGEWAGEAPEQILPIVKGLSIQTAKPSLDILGPASRWRRVGKFSRLAGEAARCRLCPRMAEQPAVLGPGNGPLEARILIVAEAPGRFGAGRTGIPFSGDRSGDNFETLLAATGLTRDDVFITNAALCNPLHNGNNSRPTAKELRNCLYYLESVLDIIEPEVVVTLGAVGLQSINFLLGTDFRLDRDAARLRATPKFTLLPLYHPSPRVTNWRRPLKRQIEDFKKIRRALQQTR